MSNSKNLYSQMFRQLIGVILICMGMVYVAYPEIQNYTTTPRWIYFSGLLSALLVFNRKETFQWSLPFYFLVTFIIVYLVFCSRSYNPFDSFIRAFPMILSFGVIMSLGIKDKGEFWKQVGGILLVTIFPIAVLSLYEIIELIMEGHYDHQSTYNFRWTFGHRNQFAQFLTLILPLVYFAGIKVDLKVLKWLIRLGLVTLILLITLLQNRTTYIVVFGIYPSIWVLLKISQLKNEWKKRAKWTFGALLIIVFTVLISPLRNFIPFVQNLTAFTYGSGNERVRIWNNSLKIWADNPLIGKGSGDWKIEILNTPLIHTQAESSTVFYQRAHNDFLQILVENGLLGFALIVAFFVTAIVIFLRSKLDETTKLVGLAGIIAFIVIANFSFPFEKIELILLLLIFLIPILRPHQIGSSAQKTIVYSGIVSSIVLLSLSSFWLIQERHYFDYLKSGDINQLRSIDLNKYTIDPTSTPIYWELGNIEYQQQNYKDALLLYSEAITKNPNHVHALNNMGSAYYALHMVDSAQVYYEYALQRNPLFIESLLNLSSLFFNKGDIDGALNTILKVPIDEEPENYFMYVTAIGKAKCEWLITLYDEPRFEAFLVQTKGNDSLLYQLSVDARISWRSYEDEMRHYFVQRTTEY